MMKTRTRLTTVISVAALLLAGCTSTAESDVIPSLTFEAPVAINADGEFHVSLGVHNLGPQPFAGDTRFAGHMEIRDPSGALQASAEVLDLPTIPAGDTAWPLEWHGELPPNTYHLTWGADGYGFTTADFTLIERDGQLALAEGGVTNPSTGAEKLITEAIADLATHLGIDASQIAVESVTPTDFPDASLGVPEPGMTYAQVLTPGYVIRLNADGQGYAYHAASDRVVLVPNGSAPAVYRSVEVTEANLRFELPVDWQQLTPEMIWTPEEHGTRRVGLTWMVIEPPVEPEAAMLPSPAQILTSEPVTLSWGDGRRFTLEVYGPAPEGGDQAPVESVETHVLVTITSGDEQRGYDFHASAPTLEQLAEIEPVLEHVLETATLGDPGTVEENQTADWSVLYDETYGFQMVYPEVWMTKDLNPQGAGVPDDWPIERMVIFYPKAWADRFEQSGPPDPSAPPAIPTLSLEVCVGPEEQFRRVYVEPNWSETLTINGIEAVRQESGSGDYVTVQYIFPSPTDPNVHVSLIDNFSQFTDRATEYPDIVDLIPAVVATFEFTE